MAQLIINVENPSILSSLRKILKTMDGVTILSPRRSSKGSLAKALADVEAGRVTPVGNVEELMKFLER